MRLVHTNNCVVVERDCRRHLYTALEDCSEFLPGETGMCPPGRYEIWDLTLLAQTQVLGRKEVIYDFGGQEINFPALLQSR